MRVKKPPGALRIQSELAQSFIRVRIAPGAKPGTRAYVRVGNLIDRALDVLTTIPDDNPSGGALPRVHRSSMVDPHRRCVYALMEPLNASERDQVLLYNSSALEKQAPHTVERMII